MVSGRPAPGRRPPSTFVALAVLGTIAALFALATVNVLLGQAGIERTTLEHRVERRALDAERLRLDVARMRSPYRVERRALELGLVPAGDVIVIGREPAAAAPEGR